MNVNEEAGKRMSYTLEENDYGPGGQLAAGEKRYTLIEFLEFKIRKHT